MFPKGPDVPGHRHKPWCLFPVYLVGISPGDTGRGGGPAGVRGPPFALPSVAVVLGVRKPSATIHFVFYCLFNLVLQQFQVHWSIFFP